MQATQTLQVSKLGLCAYAPLFARMREENIKNADLFKTQMPATPHHCWLLQHEPVFTQGLAGKPEHVLDAGTIPVIKIDRGGQVTYHGPGQLVCYLMLQLRALNYGVKELVRRIEQAVINLLADYKITAFRIDGMPGVYVQKEEARAKISAIGLRVAKHATYHGLSINVDMDLTPFSRINPCGYEGLKTAQMTDFAGFLTSGDNIEQVGEKLTHHLNQILFSTSIEHALNTHQRPTL
jgi:lipoyl(octanoyl) transferase